MSREDVGVVTISFPKSSIYTSGEETLRKWQRMWICIGMSLNLSKKEIAMPLSKSKWKGTNYFIVKLYLVFIIAIFVYRVGIFGNFTLPCTNRMATCTEFMWFICLKRDILYSYEITCHMWLFSPCLILLQTTRITEDKRVERCTCELSCFFFFLPEWMHCVL